MDPVVPPQRNECQSSRLSSTQAYKFSSPEGPERRGASCGHTITEIKQSGDQQAITHSLIPWWAASGFLGSVWLWPGDQAQARAVVEGIWLGL